MDKKLYEKLKSDKSKFQYCVWFPNFPKRNKIFKKLENAIKFIAKQKNEVVLNWFLDDDYNDTMFSLNVGK